ncbi:hypothetical protein [Teichococcus aestuarii]|uniref:hypothetical protein n=1 Tax=Teichococcus aestuarii TaxID=568898 RepID=UPI0036117DC1
MPRTRCAAPPASPPPPSLTRAPRCRATRPRPPAPPRGWNTAQTLAADPRYAALPPGLTLALRGAVGEVRGALGTAEAALPEQAIAALAQAARALEGRDDAAAVLVPPLFPAGAEATLRRLREPGPLPEAAIATGRTEEAIRALDIGTGWTLSPERSTLR